MASHFIQVKSFTKLSSLYNKKSGPSSVYIHKGIDTSGVLCYYECITNIYICLKEKQKETTLLSSFGRKTLQRIHTES